MPTASVTLAQLPTLSPEESIREVTTSPEEGWIEIVWGQGGQKRARLTLDEINVERDDEIEPLVSDDLHSPKLRQGKKLILGRRVVDAAWLIGLAESAG